VFLPFLVGFLMFLALRGRMPRSAWQRAALRAAMLTAAYAILSLEILSLFRIVTGLGLGIAWVAATIGAGTFALIAWKERGIPRPDRWAPPASAAEWFLAAGVILVLVITAIVAYFAPPQTWDSLNYHMSRVAHWAQEAAVVPFATGIEVQNSMTPGAEMLVLHLYLLGAGDRFVNFVQWSAMLGSLVAVSYIAGQLGLSRAGKWMASFVAATIPMGIIQSSSTMTDYVVAFWLTCGLAELLALKEENGWKASAFFLALAAGLAVISKPTAMAVLIPLAVVAAVRLFQIAGIRAVMKWGLIAMAVVLAINAGYMARCISLYGYPYGDPSRVEAHINQAIGFRPLASNLLRNVSFQLGTPWPLVNYVNYRAVVFLHDLMHISPTDPRTTAHGQFAVSRSTTHEDLVANPLHTLLLMASIFALIIKRREQPGSVKLMLGLVVSSVFFYALLYKFTNFGSRLVLPLYLISAPLLTYWLRRKIPSKFAYLGIGCMAIVAVPFLLWQRSRPLVAVNPNAYVGSVLTEPRESLYFANGKGLLRPYSEMIDAIERAKCQKVGLMLAGNGAEYPLWVLLGAPDEGLEIEWIIGERAPSAGFRDRAFAPCAMICERCPEEWNTFRDLPLHGRYSGFRLFLRSQEG